MRELVSKRCTKCHEDLPLNAFYFRHGKYIAPCRSCLIAKERQRRAEHGEEINAQRRKNRDPIKERRLHQASYQRHAEKRKAERRVYYATHKDECKRLSAKWQRSHPEQNALRCARRKERQRNSEGHFTKTEWSAMCSFFGGVCLCCGQTRKLVADHVIPLRDNGPDTIENIQPLCMSCNDQKHTKTIDYRDPSLLTAFLATLSKESSDAH